MQKVYQDFNRNLVCVWDRRANNTSGRANSWQTGYEARWSVSRIQNINSKFIAPCNLKFNTFIIYLFGQWKSSIYNELNLTSNFIPSSSRNWTFWSRTNVWPFLRGISSPLVYSAFMIPSRLISKIVSSPYARETVSSPLKDTVAVAISDPLRSKINASGDLKTLSSVVCLLDNVYATAAWL